MVVQEREGENHFPSDTVVIFIRGLFKCWPISEINQNLNLIYLLTCKTRTDTNRTFVASNASFTHLPAFHRRCQFRWIDAWIAVTVQLIFSSLDYFERATANDNAEPLECHCRHTKSKSIFGVGSIFPIHSFIDQ